MLRRRFGERQVGHGGTLDPDATGRARGRRRDGHAAAAVRREDPEGVRRRGRARRRRPNTLDAAGEVTATYDMSAVTVDDARRAGRRAPDRSDPADPADGVGDPRRRQASPRAGPRGHRDRTPAARRSSSTGSTSGPTDDPLVLRIEVECSAGTYIRSLAADLGTLLGGGAHLRALRRTRVGSFTHRRRRPGPDDCVLLPVDAAVRSLAPVDVDDATAALIANGRVLPRWDGPGPWAVFGDDRGRAARGVRAVRRRRRRAAKPAVVLPRT